ncbi:MAG: amidohydrolase family protein [Acidimicrobiia bacterium]|nr:amidohydrolase family protein [Acidimicrobiia bacterium]
MADPIFDPLTGPKWVLDGRIVPMTGENDVIDDGRIYINGGLIDAVQEASAPPPAGYEDIDPINTGGTIFPGLIELHNHLPYNVLPLWKVPKPYKNRDQWGRHPDYRKLISGPMNVLGRTDGLVQAVVRYVEAKALIAGTTTSQGIALFSNAGIRKYYRGLVRNAEETNDNKLPEAATKVGDVEAESAAKFLARLEKKAEKDRKLILHLAEGIDDTANDHFRALKIDDDTWAINEALVGIHCTGLRNRNFATLRVRQGSIVWSPLSNLLLYGDTTDIARARREGLRISLGSDWSPSGSKNLLMELKTARLHCNDKGIPVSSYELAQMVTCNPADMVGWGAEVGTIEPKKRADFMVIAGKSGNAYDRLLAARESSVLLVVINGVRRYGQTRLMRGIDNLEIRNDLASSPRCFNLAQDNIEQSVAGLSLADAEQRLRAAFADLPELALNLEQGTVTELAMGSAGHIMRTPGAGAELPSLEGAWFLDLDHADGPDSVHRPRLSLEGIRTGVFAPSVAASVPLSELLVPLELDKLAAHNDSRFWSTLAAEPNLPEPICNGLFAAYNKAKPQAPLDTSLAAARAALPEADPETGPLTLAERIAIVDQAIAMLDETYVHLPLKQSLHAVNPVQRLRLLKYKLTGQKPGNEVEFHAEMISIFNSMRDLHTNYLLPWPYRAYTAVLPFFLEECFEKDADGTPVPRYIVSKVAPGERHPTFRAGVEVLYWNGLPIRKAIQLNADRQAGSNPAARFARGLDAMTVRPLIATVPPDEEWVTITYRVDESETRQLRMEWRLVAAGPIAGGRMGDAVDAALGLDLQTKAVGEARKNVYAPDAAKAEAAAGGQFVDPPVAVKEEEGEIPTHLPTVMRVKPIADGEYGYIRIFTFGVDNVDVFVTEFARLVELLPDGGLIIDVRGNGGGAIAAAERILQTLTPNEIRPSRAQFTTSPLLLDLCRRHSPSTEVPGLNLKNWIGSLEQAVATGSVYSRGFPITDENKAKDRGQRYHGPVVLIVDALSYSATDILAAGFVDHEIGEVLGTAGNTGAGGANVWRHSDLVFLTGGTGVLQPLPRDTEMRVSVRRITRVGKAEGEVLEDLGIEIENRHHMTEDDVRGNNDDLMRSAIELLEQQTRRIFRTTIARRGRGRVRVTAETDGVDAIEVRIAGKAAGTIDPAAAGPHDLAGLPREETEVELIGYAGNEVVARRRELI